MKKVLLAVTLLLTAIVANAQIPCGATQMQKKAILNNPGIAVRLQDLETFTQNYQPTGQRATKVIPVVVHIIHNYGPENITKAQVLDAIRILNEDFQLRNADTTQIISQFKNVKGAPDFEFRLAQKDPAGNCTDGITRTVSDLTFSADDNVKDLISWPTNKYLNIWVVEQISFSAGGYAYYPGGAPLDEYEGIVVVNSQFGSIGQSSGSNFSMRTLTHEVGHYFNLKHTWGDNNDCGSGSCGSDNVQDTPTTSGNCLTCNVNNVSCNSLDNVQNYMDYSTCTHMFTAGQATRMLAASNSNNGGRNNLSTPSNLIATGTNDGYVAVCVPVADFLYEPGTTCAGRPIEFTDISYNASVDGTWQWNWSFPGADSTSSTLQNPVITYTAPGVYSVTLTVTNSAGTDVMTRTQIITIKPSVGLISTPYAEGFENTQWPADPANVLLDWEIQSPAINSWVRTEQAFANGNASAKIAAGTLSADSKHAMVTPAIDVSTSNVSPLVMKYKVAYQYDGTNADVLKISTSDDCGETWVVRQTRSGASLGTVTSGNNANFAPVNASEWRQETVNINNVANATGVLIKFEVTAAGGGGNVFIDDINIDKTVGLDEEQANGTLLTVYPNPITSQSQIMVSGIKGGTATLTVFDITGRQIGSKTIAAQANTANVYALTDVTGQATLPAGIYNIRLQQGATVINKRLVVAQ